MWTINGQTPEALGISVAGGSFETFAASYALIDSARNFDATPLFVYGDPVVIARDGVSFFQGKVAAPSKRADPAYEGHDYPIEDAWADLEETTYQESWKIGSGTYMFPRAVLGLNNTGDPITIGQQIEEAVTYAASVGVAIQMGGTPGGETLWPEEVENISCAEVIRKCLQFHPDWIPWIDHSTTPPTLNISTVAAMPTRTIATNGTGSVENFSVTDRGDLRPSCVRIVYEYASQIDDEVYRNAVIDKYPSGGPDGGPGVLCATIPLAGLQMQTQKSRIRTRPIPASGETGNPTKRFLTANYPRLANINLADFDVETFTTEFVPDDLADNPDAPPINERAQRLIPTSISQIPNQLVEGSIEDWMRKRVGRVKFSAEIKATESASEEVKKKLAAELPDGTTVATNAITRIYKNMTQWARAEDAPTGIAQGVYESMHAAYKTEGEVTLSTGELTAVRYHGCKLTLTGTGTTNVPIHSVSWDIPTGKTTIGFGPVPQLTPADFKEQQRRLRARKVTWWSKDERNDNKLGAENKPSARGDTVGGYHTPQTVFDGSGGGGSFDASECPFGSIATYKVGGVDKTGIRGGVIRCGDKNYAVDNNDVNLSSSGAWLVWIEVSCESNRTDGEDYFLTGIKTGNAAPSWHNKPWSSSADYDDNTNPPVSTGNGKIILPVGKLTIEDGEAKLEPTGCGGFTIGQCDGILSYSRG